MSRINSIEEAYLALEEADAELKRTGARLVKLRGFKHIDVWYGFEYEPDPWWKRALSWVGL